MMAIKDRWKISVFDGEVLWIHIHGAFLIARYSSEHFFIVTYLKTKYHQSLRGKNEKRICSSPHHTYCINFNTAYHSPSSDSITDY